MERNLDVFVDLVRKQFEYGGKKYALDNARESTDELFDKFSFKWLLGTMCKYLYRWKNLRREKEPLKIACYCYILWLKRGFHIDDKRVIPIDTTLENKKNNFDLFIKVLSVSYKNQLYSYSDIESFKSDVEDDKLKIIPDSYIINKMIYMLSIFAKREWTDIDIFLIMYIFYGSYFIWERNFSSKPGRDMDIENKEDNA
jgi:hypothetical protein